MLLVWAVVPYSVIQTNSTNILSLLAEYAGQGKWLRYILVTDAVLVLCAGNLPKYCFNVGVLTGMISSCGSIERLCLDHLLPQFFQRRLRFTNAPFISILTFAIIGLAMFGVVDTNLSIIIDQFTLCFLILMGLFAISNLFLKFNRDRLVREPHVPLPIVLSALVVVIAAMAGNVVLTPVIVGYFTVFFVVALVIMSYTGLRGRLATMIYWLYTRNKWLQSWRWTQNWHIKLIGAIKSCKRQPIIVFVKTDEVGIPPLILFSSRSPFSMKLFVTPIITNIQVPESSYFADVGSIKLVHMYDRVENIPSEFESNYRILDEVYPSVTIDMIFVEAPFTPRSILAVSKKLRVPTSLCFIQCPGQAFGWKLSDLHGVRIITL